MHRLTLFHTSMTLQENNTHNIYIKPPIYTMQQLAQHLQKNYLHKHVLETTRGECLLK